MGGFSQSCHFSAPTPSTAVLANLQ
jgi:hypothetical protein